MQIMTHEDYLDSLPDRWRYYFPRNGEEAETWQPYSLQRALASRVLAVAKTRVEGAWAAYIDAVPGQDHEREVDEVLRSGVKLPEGVALEVFPQFDGVRYAE